MDLQVISIKILKTAVEFPAEISEEESISHKFRNAYLAMAIAFWMGPHG